MTAHRHAELMRQYAEDAVETNKPWLRWEMTFGCEWSSLSVHPCWLAESQYRRKPQPININGYEVPEPCREPLEKGQDYYLTMLDGYSRLLWSGHSVDLRRLNSGIYSTRTREAAELHGKALLSFTNKENNT